MIKKTIAFNNLEGEEVKKTFFFDLSEIELIEMETSMEGGLSAKLTSVANDNNVPEIMKTIKEIILAAYGEKSSDGYRFEKSPEKSLAFSQTDAYNKLMLELFDSETALADFIQGILPEKVRQQVAKAQNA